MAHLSELETSPDKRRDNRSPLMRAKSKAKSGVKVNACPFGCEDHALDEHGYCKHLVGFSNDKKHYEPQVIARGRRVVKVDMVPDPERSGEGDEPALKARLLPVDKDDVLVQITTSWRVYRNKKK